MSSRKRITIFVGPTLGGDELVALVARIDAEVRLMPPIKQGDVLRLQARLPDVIAIIDGYFHQQPSVHHKEILWAIEQGVHVLGASSLGALRAAELDRLGMEGVGEVYALYRDGEIDGDDMVALAHGDESSRYRAYSIPLVNLRHAIGKAVAARTLSPEEAALVLAAACQLHYRDRSLGNVLARARDEGLSAMSCAELREHLCSGEHDLKKSDARQLLTLLAERCRSGQWPEVERPRVHQTTYFVKLQHDHVGHEHEGRHLTNQVVLDIQRILSPTAPALAREVERLCWACDEASARGLAPAPSSRLLARFPSLAGAKDEHEREAWLEQHYLTQSQLVRALGRRDLAEQLGVPPSGDADASATTTERWEAIAARVSARTGLRTHELRRRLLRHPGVPWDEPLVDELKLRGGFGAALRLAKQVHDVYDALERRQPGTARRLKRGALLEWFAGRWGVALEDMVRAISIRGFLNEEEFVRAARLAYFFDHVRVTRARKTQA